MQGRVGDRATLHRGSGVKPGNPHPPDGPVIVPEVAVKQIFSVWPDFQLKDRALEASHPCYPFKNTVFAFFIYVHFCVCSQKTNICYLFLYGCYFLCYAPFIVFFFK